MSKQKSMRIAVVGAGLGGLAAAGLLQRAGFGVSVYEQAPVFSRLGAGIHLGPNVTRVLRALGLENRLVETGIRPDAWVSRDWQSGDVSFVCPLRDRSEREYGAPYLTVHRGDFHAELVNAVEPNTVQFGKKLVNCIERDNSVDIFFEDGSEAEADLVIGADGVNSRIRDILLGPEEPIYTGYVAHRSIFPAALMKSYSINDCTKWWSDDRHIVVYYITRPRDEIYFVTGVPEANWKSGQSSIETDLSSLRAAFAGFHPEVQEILNVCPQATTWPILERNPLELWSRGRIVMLGDACHPMKPHMGQGAGMAIEDAAMLVRCLEKVGMEDYKFAFQLYELNRKGRTADVQRASHENTWLRYPMNPDWVFAYDAFKEPLNYPKPSVKRA
ncbi:MAG: FAD-dependent monooxygenase [Alphaproteobacteria bacterium]